MPIVANNIKVGAVQPPSKKESEFSFKKIKENIKKEFDPDFKPKQVVKKDLTEVYKEIEKPEYAEQIMIVVRLK